MPPDVHSLGCGRKAASRAMAARTSCRGSLFSGTHDFHRTMVVAVVAMRMVQAPFDDIVHMVAVRNRFVPAAGSVNVRTFMTAILAYRTAAIRIGLADSNHMLVHMVLMRVVQVSVVHVIDMPVVADGSMPAAGSVLVLVIWVDFAIVHGFVLSNLSNGSGGCRPLAKINPMIDPGSSRLLPA